LTSEVTSNSLKKHGIELHFFETMTSDVFSLENVKNKNSCGAAQHTVALIRRQCIMRGDFPSTNARYFTDEHLLPCHLRDGRASDRLADLRVLLSAISYQLSAIS